MASRLCWGLRAAKRRRRRLLLCWSCCCYYYYHYYYHYYYCYYYCYCCYYYYYFFTELEALVYCIRFAKVGPLRAWRGLRASGLGLVLF